MVLCNAAVAQTLPQPQEVAEEGMKGVVEDVPEEVLRTEMILEGRSPLDGSLMTPEAYALLEEALRHNQIHPLEIDSELQSLVFQLKLLNLLKTILPVF